MKTAHPNLDSISTGDRLKLVEAVCMSHNTIVSTCGGQATKSSHEPRKLHLTKSHSRNTAGGQSPISSMRGDRVSVSNTDRGSFNNFKFHTPRSQRAIRPHYPKVRESIVSGRDAPNVKSKGVFFGAIVSVS